MQSLTVVLLLAIVAPVVSKTYYARALANFQCKGQPVSAQVEFMEANDNEAAQYHLTTVNEENGKFDVTAHDKSHRNLFQVITFQDIKNDFFLRVHHDCGCGAYFDTSFIPHEYNFESEEQANEKPYDYGVVEISKCRGEGGGAVVEPLAEKADVSVVEVNVDLPPHDEATSGFDLSELDPDHNLF